MGFRTTKAVWPIGPSRAPNSGGVTCSCKPYGRHVLALQADGFEIAYHLGGPQSATREESIQALVDIQLQHVRGVRCLFDVQKGIEGLQDSVAVDSGARYYTTASRDLDRAVAWHQEISERGL